jgi:nitroimidazol reductase NimA-like FMN-containing flavoprotein (pyridoxamine 5'-phosphate oxidase superfamily)
MIVHEMRGTDCYEFVRSEHVARLACSRDDQPYIVPIQYAYSESRLFSFSLPGLKIDIMRSNPKVCVEIERVFDEHHWKCVLIEGVYHELESEADRQHAWELLQGRNDWWEVGSLKPGVQEPTGERSHLFYEIVVNQLTGREATQY